MIKESGHDHLLLYLLRLPSWPLLAAAAITLLLWLLVIDRPQTNFGREYHSPIKRPAIQANTETKLGGAKWLADKEVEMEGRKVRIRRVCEEQGQELRWKRAIRKKFFLADHKHHLGYCRTPKVTSTNRMCKHFVLLTQVHKASTNLLRVLTLKFLQYVKRQLGHLQYN